MVGKMNKDDIATSYRINMAACREANDMLTKENEELRRKLERCTQVVETDKYLPDHHKVRLLTAIRAMKKML